MRLNNGKVLRCKVDRSKVLWLFLNSEILKQQNTQSRNHELSLPPNTENLPNTPFLWLPFITQIQVTVNEDLAFRDAIIAASRKMLVSRAMDYGDISVVKQEMADDPILKHSEVIRTSSSNVHYKGYLMNYPLILPSFNTDPIKIHFVTISPLRIAPIGRSTTTPMVELTTQLLQPLGRWSFLC